MNLSGPFVSKKGSYINRTVALIGVRRNRLENREEYSNPSLHRGSSFVVSLHHVFFARYIIADFSVHHGILNPPNTTPGYKKCA